MALNIEVGQDTVPRTNHTVVILDESGSMASIKKQAIDGLNEQVQTCRSAETPFEKRVTIYTFGGGAVRRLAWMARPEEIADFKDLDYTPDGDTPLRDAVGKAIKELSAADNEDNTFLLLIITDGQENASKDWSVSDLAEAIQTKQKTGRWTFTVQGANVDLENLVGEWGIPQGNVAAWDNTVDGTVMANTMRTIGTQSYYAAASAGARNVASFYGGEMTPSSMDGIDVGASSITKDDTLDKKTPKDVQ